MIQYGSTIPAHQVWPKTKGLDFFQLLPTVIQGAVYQCPDGYDGDSDIVSGTRIICDCADGSTHTAVVGAVDTEGMNVEFVWQYPDGNEVQHRITVRAGETAKTCTIQWELSTIDSWWLSVR